MGKYVSGENRIWFCPFQIQVASWHSAEFAATKAVVVCYTVLTCVRSLLNLDDLVKSFESKYLK